MSKWWERFPGRLEWELEALRAADIPFQLDEDAFQRGIARLTVSLVLDGMGQELSVTFPDLYPYFRFEIRANQLSLEHHQNPFTNQLCVIGRATDSWDISDSVASMLTQQVPKVIEANAAEAAGAEFVEEERQAEPVSEYFPYHPHSIVVVDGGWRIDPAIESGVLTLGFNELSPKQRPLKILRAAVLRVQSDSGTELARADERIARRYVRTGSARWVRTDKLPLIPDAAAFFSAAQDLDPRHKKSEPIAVEDGELRVIGIRFPEEAAYHEIGEGWIFAAQFLGHRTKKGRELGHYFARVARGGPSDFLERAPELTELPKKTIAVFGLGCIGAPSALEFARAGIGELRLLDGDHVDIGTALRWPFGLAFAGRPKVDTLAFVIREHYPFTKVEPINHYLGLTRHSPGEGASDEQVIAQMTDGASLIYDASAEGGVQHFLSDLARELGIPYVGVAGKQGGWGGYVVRIVPGVTEGCWSCLQHSWGDRIPLPPAAASEFIQPAGCGNPTFLAAGFDMSEIAIQGVRMAVSTLTSGGNSRYPRGDWDVQVWAARDSAGAPIAPTSTGYRLSRHPGCGVCGAS